MKDTVYTVVYKSPYMATEMTLEFKDFDTAFDFAIDLKGDNPRTVVNVYKIEHVSNLN